MIEDDSPLAEMLGDFLSRFGMEVTTYEDPYLGMSALEVQEFDLLLLDLSLPGIDGLEVLRNLRKKHTLPVIISSARTDLEDKLMGLQLGADDYLPKPYDPKELHARILTVLRRLKPSGNVAAPSIFQLDEEAFEIRMDGEAIKLTRAEHEILAHLIRRHNCVVSREEIISNSPALRDGNPKSIEVLVGRIRQKISDDSRRPKYLTAVRGVGYKLIG